MNLQVFDAHQDLLWYEQNKKKGEVLQTGFQVINDSAVKLVVASVFIDSENKTNEELIEMVRAELNDYQRLAKENKMIIVKGKKDLSTLLESERHGLLLHIEGLDFLTPDNENCLTEFYELGLRSVGLVWGKRNAIMASANDEGGLSDFGRKLIKKINKLGIIIDLAHANEASFYDVMTISEKPVMVSHGNADNICPGARNFKDEQISLLDKKRGVIGIFFSKKYLTTNSRASLEDAFGQAEYLYKLAPNAVMIGSDFGGITTGTPVDLGGIDKYPDLFDKIEEKLGTRAKDKIAYENFKTFLEKHFYESSD